MAGLAVGDSVGARDISVVLVLNFQLSHAQLKFTQIDI